MTKYFTAAFLLAISSSLFAAEDVTDKFNLSGGLEGCKIYLTKKHSLVPVYLHITVCPEKQTVTSKGGKNPNPTSNITTYNNKSRINVDGINYYTKDYLDDTQELEKININGETYYKLKPRIWGF